MADLGQLSFAPIVPEYEESNENIDDLAPLAGKAVSQAVVSGTDWTTETVITQINKGNIQLNPRFQRRDAWDTRRKSRFIESLILGLPIPQLVLAESKDRKGSYIVIDGKQRLLSIRQFAAEPNDVVYTRLRLSGLLIRPELVRKSLHDLKKDPELQNDLSAFENQPIRTVVIKNWPDENFLYHVFLRLNTGSVPLSPQELRQALHPGPFVTYADEASGASKGLRHLLKLRKPDFRMRDVELLIRFIAFSLYLSEYNGDLKSFLDATCKRLNAEWPSMQPIVVHATSDLEAGYTVARTVFGNSNVFRKWAGDKYERQLNRAIFDIMMYYFRQPAVRAAVLDAPEAVEGAFKTLCASSSEFLASIERTTKSLDATASRLNLWGHALRDTIGTEFHIPALIGDRIR